MAERSTGTITFLFTDIEGSTQMWEADADGMEAALARHDAVLHDAIEQHGGHQFKHTGDGVCAAFSSAGAAIRAAVQAQKTLVLPVRMGLATGEAQQRDDDYFGLSVNRAARVMSAAHGGQILTSGLTAALVDDVEFLDLGEHRLRGLSDTTRLYQVVEEGLPSEFGPVRTLQTGAGNLPTVNTALVGRDDELAALIDLVRSNSLVTLTGVGGVGKSRLSVQAASELRDSFPDGVWLVELAPVADPAAVPDAVATTIGITPEPGTTIAEGTARGLAGRQTLIVLDNCEHVLHAASELVETILHHAGSVKVVASSREALGLPVERVFPVPPLKVETGASSPAVQLFVERTRAVKPRYELDSDAETRTVADLCRRLDGVALAIELAAARMGSMTAREVLERLDDRFRLLSGSSRGLEHHQTLRRAVSWSYDLLEPAERQLLRRCSVFADGFDVHAAAFVCSDDEPDEYAVLDGLDSLVRKSLVTVGVDPGRTRYGLLETIRQFGQEELASSGDEDDVRDRHASYFAAQATERWTQWNGPEQGKALDWVDREFANLRLGFRWATDHGRLATATTIAAHTAMLSFILQRFEPVSWAEEILPAAIDADLPQLPRLSTAAAVCALTGRPDVGTERATRSLSLEADPRYDPFEPGWSSFWAAIGHRYTGQLERWFEISDDLIGQTGDAHVIGLVSKLAVLPGVGRAEEAALVVDETMAAARALGNPVWLAFAMMGRARTYAATDPARAMEATSQCLDFARDHRLNYFEAVAMREIAGLEETLGEPEQALELFDEVLALYHRAGNHGSVATTLADIAVLFARLGRDEIGATIYGTSTRSGISMVSHLSEVLDELRAELGEAVFDRCVATGAAMEFNEAMEFVRAEIADAQKDLSAGPA